MKIYRMKSWTSTLLSLLAMVTISCSDDFLNTQPTDRIPSEVTWSDPALSEAFVFNVYSSLGDGGFEEEGLSSLTDEAMFTHSGRGINVITEGSLSASSTGNVRIIPQWNELFLSIRGANIAIKELPQATFSNDDLKDRLLGESYFLRAYFYHQVMRYYGSAPIIEQVYDLDDDYAIARGTFQQNIDFIIGDLDKAISLLEGKEKTPGRASKLSAMGLKSRVLLYAASDLRDATTASANSTLLAGYPNIDLIAYTSGSRTDRWNKAKIAAKELLHETTGYKLNLTEPAPPQEAIENYISIAMGGGSAVGDPSARTELLFERTYTTELENSGIRHGIHNGPNGYHNWAGNTPIQQLVDDYQMMDGTKFSWDNPEHSSEPYANRDPRFYATILYDGADWKPRPSDVVAIDPYDQIQTLFYFNKPNYNASEDELTPGVDTRNSPIENWNGTRTGYYVRKFIDPDPNLADNFSNGQVIPWPYIRYTEIVLNYVEACLETGGDEMARSWLNKIRYRAGMPAIEASGSELVKAYRNERRIELVYEEHRYHDARRWMIAEETLGRGIKMIKVTASLKPGATPHEPYKYDPSVYNYTYNVIDNTDNETRTWEDKMYYMPINRDEINRNALLIQNPGY